jgi:CO/xanthine dehydrogenase Mo-binding subunit
VRHVGDVVAAVAESRWTAEAMADAAVVDYEPLLAVSIVREAVTPDTPPMGEPFGTNLVSRSNAEIARVPSGRWRARPKWSSWRRPGSTNA